MAEDGYRFSGGTGGTGTSSPVSAAAADARSDLTVARPDALSVVWLAPKGEIATHATTADFTLNPDGVLVQVPGTSFPFSAFGAWFIYARTRTALASTPTIPESAPGSVVEAGFSDGPATLDGYNSGNQTYANYPFDHVNDNLTYPADAVAYVRYTDAADYDVAAAFLLSL